MLNRMLCQPTMKERMISLIVKSMLNAYMDWKHPNKYSSISNNPKYIQQRKQDYYERRKMYDRQKGKS